MAIEQEHDKGFRDILSNRKVFAMLLKSFIPGEWTARIAPENLEMVSASFVTPPFTKQEADIIYKYHEDQSNSRTDNTLGEVYFYCLLELQSRVDYSMPIRLFVYMATLLMKILNDTPLKRIRRKDFRLPRIIPLVLYNGKEPWTAAREFAEVYGGGIPGIGEYGLNFKYYLLDVNRYKSEELLGKGDLLSAVFMVDQSRRGLLKGADRKAVQGYAREIGEKLEQLKPYFERWSKEEYEIFRRWMEGIVFQRIPEDEGLVKPIREHLSRKKKPGEGEGVYVSNLALELEEAVAILEKERKAIANDKKAIADDKKVLEEEKTALAEKEKALREWEKSLREAQNP